MLFNWFIFAKGYKFLSFAKNVRKNVGKNISKNLSGRYRQKLFDHRTRSATDALKTAWQGLIQETTEATGDLIDSKVANKITNSSPQNNSETDSQIEIPEKIHILSE